jgi:hypothetical protein
VQHYTARFSDCPYPLVPLLSSKSRSLRGRRTQCTDKSRYSCSFNLQDRHGSVDLSYACCVCRSRLKAPAATEFDRVSISDGFCTPFSNARTGLIQPSRARSSIQPDCLTVQIFHLVNRNYKFYLVSTLVATQHLSSKHNLGSLSGLPIYVWTSLDKRLSSLPSLKPFN